MPTNNHVTYTTDEEVIAALFRSGGNVTKTAKLLGLANVVELRERIRKKPNLQQAKMEAFEQMLDNAEEKVVRNMTKTDAKWILERRGRMRGWGNVTTNANVNLNVGTYDLSNLSFDERLKLLETINGAEQLTDENTDTE